MRTRLMRATSVTVLALMVGAMGRGEAQQAMPQPASPRSRAPAVRYSLPEGADEGAFDRRMLVPEPDLPPAIVMLDPAQDVTGSFEGPETQSLPAPPQPASSPKAESRNPSPAIGPVPGSQATPPIAESTAPVTAAMPTSGDVASPAPPPAAAPPAQPVSSVSQAPSAPPAQPAAAAVDPAGLGPALSAFLAEAAAGDTPTQMAERKMQRDAIGAYYASRGNTPLWIVGGRLGPAAHAAVERLAHAPDDGLDLSRFPVAEPHDGDPAALAKAELVLSEAVVAYARQASGSRVNVARLGGLIDLRPAVADVARILDTVPGAGDAGAALAGFNPPQPGYAALRDKLAELRQGSEGPAKARIPYGPALRTGMTDDRVPLIRAWFGLDAADDEGVTAPLLYDARIARAVADFQRAHRMPASGVLSARTIAALSGGNPALLENDIIANMELWRWMPRELAPDRIEVNIPAYTARVLREGEVAHETRVVVGQPDKPTPVFVEQMKFIIVNPYWNVPLSIIKTEMMPKLASDPNYFTDHGYETVERDGVTYVRQPPGDGNALGRIKFMFPNSHSVYLHDTNARSYFARDMRALSHGCVRVEEPFSFAEAVMGRQNGWSEARIRKLIGGQERTINLPKPLPILITYFTAFVDKDAGFQTRDDVYGYAGKVKAALGLQGEVGAFNARPAKRAAAGADSVIR